MGKAKRDDEYFYRVWMESATLKQKIQMAWRRWLYRKDIMDWHIDNAQPQFDDDNVEI